MQLLCSLFQNVGIGYTAWVTGRPLMSQLESLAVAATSLTGTCKTGHPAY